MHRRSFSSISMASPTWRALDSRLWWVSMAPLGLPVVPEVYWMLTTSSGPHSAWRWRRSSRTGLLGEGQQVVPAPHTGGCGSGSVVVGRDEYDVAQVGEASGVELAGQRGPQLRNQLVNHAHVVGGAVGQGRGAEPADQDEGANLRLLQHVGEFVGAVGRVDGDEDGARSWQWQTGRAPTRL